jgi:hypothetical protein
LPRQRHSTCRFVQNLVVLSFSFESLRYLIKYRLAGEEKEGAKSSEVYARISRLSNGRGKHLASTKTGPIYGNKKISAGMSIRSPAVRLTDGGEEMNARVIAAITTSASNKGRMINQQFRLNQ